MEDVQPKKLSSGKQRAITSVIYVVVWLSLCALKWCVPQGWGAFGFDLVFCAVAVLGSLEFLRAIDRSRGENEKISLPQRIFTISFCAVIVPLYVLCELTMGQGLLAIACAFAIYAMFLSATSVFDHKNSSVKNTVFCIFCMLYCGVLSSMLSGVNHLPQNSMAAILVLTMCPMFTDSGAFIFGKCFKRFVPLKLAPQISPNKTVIGAVGGIIGGILAAVISYLLINYLGGFNGVELTFTSDRIHPVVSFILVGMFTAIVSQVGDLFESALKRECGIKDMGNVLPGHGGVLDRFDSMLYCTLIVMLAFGTIII
ncbi:MAG: phosphatidate cytidylyltransferase [Clostridia bacterium]|nr:phosphatidate cytidylyltransferase [Clostridia bacterium]